jgi:heme A synthase
MLQKQHYVAKIALAHFRVKKILCGRTTMKKSKMLKAAGIPAAGQAAGSPRLWFPRYAWAVLAYNVAIILWGALVRATGSGAGCGNHWPLCDGRWTTLATLIEFAHRATSGIDTLLVVLLVVGAFRVFPKRHPARLAAALSMAFLVTEALIGAGLVLFDQVARNASVSRAWWLSGHLVNTLTLVACLSLTTWWGMGKPAVQFRGKAAWKAGASLVIVVLLGVSGAIAALGDTLFPARSLAAGLAQDLDPAANIFLRLRFWHPLIAVAAGAWLVFFAVSSASRGVGERKLAWGLLGLVGIQIVAGVTNILLLVPFWTQMVHLLLADLLWIALVLFCASTLAAEGPAESTPPL